MTLPTAQPTAITPTPGLPPGPHVTGPLARYLAHPGAETARLLHHLRALAGHLGVTVGPALAGAGLLLAVSVALVRRTQARRLVEGARLVQVLAPPDVDPQGAATLWTNLVALLRPAWRRALGAQPHLGFELTATDAGLTIAWWVPGTIPPGLVERAVEAAWPGARTETIPAGPPLVGGGVATGGTLRLTLPEHYPLRAEHKVDPLRPLLGALDAMHETESACVQILARPVTGRRVGRLHKAASARRAGRPATRAARVVDLVTPGPSAQPANTDPSRSADVADILDKAAQPCWAICVRYALSSTATDSQAAARLRGRAHAVASAFSLFAGRNRLDRHRLRHPAQVLAGRRFGRGDLVSVAELAALAHLPTDQTVPGLARAGARAVAPPPAVARPAALAPAAARVASPKVLGDAQAGGRRPVTLSIPDARYHLHVMGATGSGKSTLLTNLVLSDIEAGRGVVVIDPKGDLITDLCDRLPAGAESRTVLIDPEDPDAAPILNVLAGPDPDLVVDNLVGIFRSIFAAFWGPRTDDVLRAACLTLLRHAAATGTSTSLADVPRLLADDAFRVPIVATVADDTVGLGGFWESYEAMSEANRAQVIGPLMNKLRAFLLRDFVRSVVGRPDSSFDMGQVLDGGVCLVRVPKGILGEDTARLLGSFVVAKVWQTATHRARLGQAARVEASLVVDECQNFLHLPRSFDEMLAEARGYRLSMVLAHQHLGQLGKELRETVSANARTKVWFTMSPEDARALERHVAPNLTEHDLAHLGAYVAAARLVVDGEEAPAFTLTTRPAPPAIAGRADAVRDANRAVHARPASAPQPRSPLEGRNLPAPSTAAQDRGGTRVPGEVPRDIRSGLRPDVHGALHHGLRPGLEPSGGAEPPRQGDTEGSVASADSRGRGS
ncbi:MAG: type IV secretion system DNA-binding domain-containing protein [Actinomycetota bacterium]|nr:type IV secretion system DNA-binding domain-containing protein [Actinomycetota bacterium]